MTGDSRRSEHLLNVFKHLPPSLFEPFHRRLDRPPERVDPEPPDLSRHVFEARRAFLGKAVGFMLALLALADPFERRGDFFGQRDLEALVGGDLATALLAVVLLLEPGVG